MFSSTSNLQMLYKETQYVKITKLLSFIKYPEKRYTVDVLIRLL